MNNDVRDVIFVVAINDREIKKSVDRLVDCVVKRLNKNQYVDEEYLTYCSMMSKITLSAKRYEEKYGGHVTKEERIFGAHQLAEYIISEATEKSENKAV